MGHIVRDDLQHIPVLYDLAVVIEAKDIYAGPIVLSGNLLMAVEDNVVTIGKCPLEVDLLPWVFGVEFLEMLDERVLSAPHRGIVLDIDVAGVFLHRFTRLTVIKHQAIHRLRVLYCSVPGLGPFSLSPSSAFLS